MIVTVQESSANVAPSPGVTVGAATTDGFQLAEEDLRLRGPGQFFGCMQHGLPDLKIADVLGDMDILPKAREAATATLENQEDMDFVLPVLAVQYREKFARIIEM